MLIARVLTAHSGTLNLALAGHCSWLVDLRHTLLRLPTPVTLDYWQPLTMAVVDTCLGDIRTAVCADLAAAMLSSSPLVLVQGRLVATKDRKPVARACAMRVYLDIDVREYRVAITRLVTSDNPLAVEQLRRCMPPVPHERRVCRFCRPRYMIEDEAHMLLDCTDAWLTLLRDVFLVLVFKEDPLLLRLRRNLGTLRDSVYCWLGRGC